MGDSTDKVALVTGANKGIGREIARQLGGLGMTVLVGARDWGRGEDAARELRDEGTDARFVRLDVTDHGSMAAAARSIDEEFGRLDVLVNNAGIPAGGGWATAPLRATEYTADLVRAVYEVNVLGAVAVTHAMLPLLRRSPSARIVNMSSELGSLAALSDPGAVEELDPSLHIAGSRGLLAYNSSKAALNAIPLMYAGELGDEGILVNAVGPGFTVTDLNDHRGELTAEQAATVQVKAATLADDGPTGRFLSRYGEAPW